MDEGLTRNAILGACRRFGIKLGSKCGADSVLPRVVVKTAAAKGQDAPARS
jgi:hypothetical protein